MTNFRKIAEDRIREAMDNGEFENLRGKGKPLDLREYFQAPPHLRAAFGFLKNADILPREISLKKDIEVLEGKLRRARSEKKKAEYRRKINEMTVQLNIMLEKYHFNKDQL